MASNDTVSMKKKRGSVYDKKLGRFAVDGMSPSPHSKGMRDSWIQQAPSSVGKSPAMRELLALPSKLNLNSTPKDVRNESLNLSHHDSARKQSPKGEHFCEEVLAEIEAILHAPLAQNEAKVDMREMMNVSLAGEDVHIAAVPFQSFRQDLPFADSSVIESEFIFFGSSTAPLTSAIPASKSDGNDSTILLSSSMQQQSFNDHSKMTASLLSGRRSLSPSRRARKDSDRLSASSGYQRLIAAGLAGRSPMPDENSAAVDRYADKVVGSGSKAGSPHRSFLNNSLNGSHVTFVELSPYKTASSRGSALVRSFMSENSPPSRKPVDTQRMEDLQRSIHGLETRVVERERMVAAQEAALAASVVQRDARLQEFDDQSKELEMRNETLQNMIDSTIAEKQRIKKLNIKHANEFYEKHRVAERFLEKIKVLEKKTEQMKLEAERDAEQFAAFRPEIEPPYEDVHQEEENAAQTAKAKKGQLFAMKSFRSFRVRSKQQEAEEALRQAHLENIHLANQLCELNERLFEHAMHSLQQKTEDAKKRGSVALNKTIHMRDQCDRAQKATEHTILVDDSVVW